MWKAGRVYRMGIKDKRGQNLLEYGLIIGIVTVALLGMQTYFKRGVQSVIKVVADNYGPQGDPIKDAEIAIKKQIYSNKRLYDSTSISSWRQNIHNKEGEGKIRSELSGDNTMTGSSVWVGGDYRTRRADRVKSGPSVPVK